MKTFLCVLRGSKKAKTFRLPSNVLGRTNIIGFLSRNNEAYFTYGGWLRHPSGDYGDDERIPPLAQPWEVGYIEVMDNAVVYRKAVEEANGEWFGLRVWDWVPSCPLVQTESDRDIQVRVFALDGLPFFWKDGLRLE